MAKATSSKFGNLAFRTYKADGERKGSRRVGDAVDDTVGDALAAAQTPEQMIEVAVKAGLPRDVAEEKAKKAPNFGQFRMTLGNMVRGITSRVALVKATTGLDVEPKQVGTKKLLQSFMADWRKANRPVKDGAKPTGKKKDDKEDGAKKDGEFRKSSTKGKAAEPAASERKGAPSKAEAAGRGKGGKSGGKKSSRWQRNKKPAAGATGGDDASAGVGDAGGEASEQESLADQLADTNG